MPDISSTIVPTNVITSNVSPTLQIGVPSFDIGGQRLSSLVDVDLSNAEEYSILHKEGNVFKATLYLDGITVGNSVARDGTFINLNSSGIVTLSSNTNWEDLSFSYTRPDDGAAVNVTLESLSLNDILSKVYKSELTASLAYDSTVEQVDKNAEFTFDIGALQSTVATLSTIDSPTFTGIPRAPTAAVDTATTQIANTAYVVGQGYLKQTAAASTYQPLDSDLTALAALPSLSLGLVRKSAANTYTFDSSVYLTGNQNITFVGDVSGQGTTAVNLTLASTGVSSGTYNSSSTISQFTVDAKGRVTNISSPITIAPAFANITNKPTTLAGYGITNGQPLNIQLTGISSVTGTQGFLKKTEGSYVFDDSTYLTGNQNITFSGDVSGQGTTSVNLTLPNVVTAGTYRSVTVDAKGRVTSGDNPTTVSEYGLTDAVTTGNVTQIISGQKTFNGEIHVPVPTQSTHAATKAYVDTSLQGLQTKPIVRAATTGPLNATYTNGPNDDGIGSRLTANVNGIISVDGVNNFDQYQGVLVKDQVNKEQNGRYYVFDPGSSTQPYILIRCGLCDEPTEISGAYIFVGEGDTYASNGYVLSISDVNIFQVGVDPISVIQFSGAGQIEAGAGLTKDGNTLNVAGTAGRISINGDSVDLATIGTAGTYRSVTVDAYGRVSAGTSPTTIDGYGLTGVVQPHDATLTALAGVTTSADKIIYSTGTDTFTTTTLSAFGRSLIDDADAIGARSTLGLGSIATQNSSDISISGGTINGTSIGASNTASGAFTTLSASGNFSVDSTTLFVNANTDKVGIATNNPQYTLDVNGEVKGSKFIVPGGTSLGFLKANGDIDTNTYLTAETDSQTLTWNGADGTLSISNGNSVDLDGRYLQAESDTLDSVTTRGSTTTNNISTAGSVTANNLVYKGGNTEGAALNIGTNDAQDLNFETNGSTRMTVTSAGNIGIGTTTPQQSIDLRPIPHVANQTGGIRFDNTSGAWPCGIYIRSDSSGNPRLSLDAPYQTNTLNLYNNLVGVGTTIPTQKLDVVGNIGVSNGLIMTGVPTNLSDVNYIRGLNSSTTVGFLAGTGVLNAVDGPFFAARGNTYSAISNQRGMVFIAAGAVNIPTGLEGSLRFITGSNADRMIVDRTGNVGIGTTAPATKLHVSGSGQTGRIRIQNTDNDPVLEMQSSSGTSYLFTNAGDWMIRTDSTSRHVKLQAGSTTGQGRVQIGSGSITGSGPTPASQLVVRNNTDNTTSNILDLQDFAGNSKLQVRSDGQVTVVGNISASGSVTANTVSATSSININGTYDIQTEIEKSKILAIAYAIAL